MKIHIKWTNESRSQTSPHEESMQKVLSMWPTKNSILTKKLELYEKSFVVSSKMISFKMLKKLLNLFLY